ncbi:unnamed protein product [Echinostoma caproni]|uniref:receptor protein serine/threonine kinase n=1 Tax=Echinostoma caproni TaxID=27848 RepID=A0A183B961_9TREM|nr:unnamed protein product [Echinostoma caproni]
MAPEILDGAIQFTGRSILCTDIYSLSLCLWELLSAAVPPTSVELLQTGTNTTDPTVHTNTQKQVVELLMPSTGVASLCKPRRVWLPYELELGRNGPNPETVRHLVSMQKHRPYAHTSWFESPLYAQFYRTITESWDSEPEARLSATCVLERLNSIHTLLFKSTEPTAESSPRTC